VASVPAQEGPGVLYVYEIVLATMDDPDYIPTCVVSMEPFEIHSTMQYGGHSELAPYYDDFVGRWMLKVYSAFYNAEEERWDPLRSGYSFICVQE
jgi:hypothetical protein